MDWHVTMLAVHAVAFLLAVVLVRQCPCWMQTVAMTGLAIATASLVVAYALAIAKVWWWWQLEFVGYSIEHFSVLLYLFRIAQQGGLQWSRSQARSHSSPS